ncbi:MULTISPECIES: hypothetical protein [unclassified Mycobacterium]|uniref:hypothetical protein n=1 Tax=unclassified Mycobacterium TaxID=2642494 RepID=UPI0007FDC991|nr:MULTISPECIES: hypothetical protein [unclassified Mycobacterium]OBG55823.1 hypothetical protein A5704_24960 [Mycobacterium sp. E735]OBG56397.1 hypothetical protein A5703_06365 [Mycobacterium sp. E188]OBG69921.1 hypothetical protein A5701_04125 [Mycobacterium sp. E3305]OBG74231.1 hypothetical protein A9X05_26160 [Mycobacterium sp. E3298]OBH27871.1 hypothetical protein A9X03_01090 [Mycobacterium sp. E1715]
MRAEEGDETVKDYAAEGKQALGRIKSSQRSGNRFGDVAKRFARLWGGDRAAEDGPGEPG